MLHQAATLNSSMSLREALERLEHYPDEAFVVVRRREGEARYYYHRQVGDIRELATHAANWDGGEEAPLKVVLDLHEYTASPTVQVGEASPTEIRLRHGVLLDGETVVGVLESEALAGAGPPRPRAPSAAMPRGGGGPPDEDSMPRGAPPVDMPRGVPAAPSGSFPPRERDWETAARGVDEDSRGGGAGAAEPPQPDRSPFEAFPDLQAPDGVPHETEFELVVGLSAEQVTAGTEAIAIASAPSEAFDLVVQVIAPEFDAPGGTKRILHVVRNDLAANQVRFRLRPAGDAPVAPQQAALEVQFSHEGEVCGRAWREITVVPAGQSVTDVPSAAAGSSPVSAPGGSHAPDLTVSITEANEDGRFVWLFTSPHAVNLYEDQQVVKRLSRDNARSFAVKVLKGIPAKDGTGMVGMHMTGASRQIADAMPVEFWKVLGEVWALVHAEGRVPRLLLLSAETYVPWELASVEDAYVDPALLDGAYPKMLHAQARVGRWLPPRPRARGADRPSQPPALRVDVGQMAVVAGDYLAMNGTRPLPEAIAEGEALSGQYQAVKLNANWKDLAALLSNRIEKDGQQVDIELLHFACHGQVDLANPNNNGIVLDDGRMKLDSTTVMGCEIGQATQPFVFLNACEVGMAEETLGSYGGLAGAFLNEGFRGFIAPLWAVNDKIAHRLSLKFYEQTLTGGKPVSEVMRELRLDYDPQAPMPSATPLAYVFYGHPDLVLDRQ